MSNEAPTTEREIMDRIVMKYAQRLIDTMEEWRTGTFTWTSHMTHEDIEE